MEKIEFQKNLKILAYTQFQLRLFRGYNSNFK